MTDGQARTTTYTGFLRNILNDENYVLNFLEELIGVFLYSYKYRHCIITYFSISFFHVFIVPLSIPIYFVKTLHSISF